METSINKNINLTKKIALTSLLCAQAIAISFLEGLIPTSVFLPPGAKLGFSNIVTMFCVETLSFPYALCVTFFKAMFAFLTRGVTAGIMSFFGGLVSAGATYLLFKLKNLDVGYIGIAVCSAMSHNLAQLSVSVFITGTPSMFMYAPVLFISSVVTGILTGILLKTIMPALNKQNKIFIKGVENR